MTNSLIEMQTTLNTKRQNFINWLELNVEDQKVLASAINYFEYEEQVRKATLRLAEIDLAAARSIDLDNKNLQNVIAEHKIQKCFNPGKADKWLSKALELVLVSNHTFDGLTFNHGAKNTLKTNI